MKTTEKVVECVRQEWVHKWPKFIVVYLTYINFVVVVSFFLCNIFMYSSKS